MSTYGFDSAWNKVEVAEAEAVAILQTTVAGKQAKLNATEGAPQTDANDLKVTGIYYIPSTADNIPSASNYVIIVCSVDDTNSAVMQVAITTDGTYIYTRMYANTAWTIWKRWASQTYVNSTFPRTYSGIELPDDTVGKNGDVYYYISDNKITKVYAKLNDKWEEITVESSGSSTELEERVTTLEGDVDDIERDITDLNAKVPGYMKMLGTSVTTASGVGQVTFATMGITGKTLDEVMCVVKYASSAGAGNCYASCQISTDYINVYIRNGVTSGLAADGTYAITLFYTYH